MWKKEEGQAEQPSTPSTPRVATPRPSSGAAGPATIGPSISIKGDVTGSEDLLIQGRVDGSVTLNDHSVGVGKEGRVNANIAGRLITIEGRVEGDLTAQEQIVLRGTAQVKGDIKAPRVVLEDGATFRGLVDMGSQPKGEASPSAGKAAASSDAKSPDAKPSGAKSSEAKPSDASARPSGKDKDAAKPGSQARA